MEVDLHASSVAGRTLDVMIMSANMELNARIVGNIVQFTPELVTAGVGRGCS